MATIGEITNAASYTGSKELGGYVPSAIDIESRPLQTLAAFTAAQNKAFYDERVRNADNKIAELAEISAYDITNARGKDKELAIEKMSILEQAAKEYAQMGVPKNPQEKIKQELAFKEKINDATKVIKSLNKRGLSYQVRLNAINQENTTAAIKNVKKRQLDEEFDSTSWDTPISAEEKFNIILPKIGAPAYTKNTTSVDTGNEIVQQEVQIFNPAANLNNATAEVLGFSENMELPANASPEQRRQFELSQASGGQVKVLNDAATFLNEALQNPNYRNEDGTINTDAVTADNRIAAGILKGIDRYNKYATDLQQDINNGYYTTKTGGRVNLLNIMSADDVFTIDKNKPLSPEKLVFIQKFLDAAPDQKDEKIIVTGEQTRREDLAKDWYNAKTARINATKPSASASAGREADAGGSNQAAILFGEHINRIKQFQERGGGGNLIVGYDNTDPTTRKVLGLTEGQRVRYLDNGTAMIGVDKDGNGGVPMTIEEQKLNFIVTVKGGSRDEAQLDSKFIEEQESGFKNTLGTTSGTAIWNGWGAPVKSSSAPASTTQGKSSAMSDAEFDAYLRSKGLKK